MGALSDGYPCHVEVAGERVPVWRGFRRAIRLEQLDMADPEAPLKVLALTYGGRDADLSKAHPAVLAHAPEALSAALDWHSGAWGQTPYGRPKPPSGRRSFDWEADAAVVLADFQRLYGVDLSSPDTQMHWWRFCALFLAAMRTEGSLLRAAVSARMPMPRGLDKAGRRDFEARREAWALPPTEQEAAAMAAAEFAE